MMEMKYVWKLTEALKAKEQGGFFNRMFVKLARKSLLKRLETLKDEDIPEGEYEAWEREIKKL